MPISDAAVNEASSNLVRFMWVVLGFTSLHAFRQVIWDARPPLRQGWFLAPSLAKTPVQAGLSLRSQMAT